MGIDKPDIRHVIQNGVPESMLSLAQELERAGKDGHQACATIMLCLSDMLHANPWIFDNLSNTRKCDRIISSFSESWQYVNAHLAGVVEKFYWKFLVSNTVPQQKPMGIVVIYS